AGGVVAVLAIYLVVVSWLNRLARRQALDGYLALRRTLLEAGFDRPALLQNARSQCEKLYQGIYERQNTESQRALEKFTSTMKRLKRQYSDRVQQAQSTFPARLAALEAQRDRALEELDSQYPRRIEQIEQSYRTRSQELAARYEQARQENQQRYDRQWQEMAERWQRGMERFDQQVASLREACRSCCPGWEAIEELDLVGQAERVGREAAELVEAKPCPSGVTDVILDSTQMVLQIHESCGHPTELDRVFGTEAGYAGTSFLTPDKLGKLRYGSEHVTLVADATVPHGLGTFKYDDEGVPGQRTVLVDRGLFSNYLTSRETAERLGQESNGTMRADGWNRMPLIRMTNINLEPGDWTLEEMIRDTKDGLLMEINRSWSIDDKRLNFQFGCEVAWEIKDGSLGEMVKNPNYTGITPEFWSSCDAVADRDHWRLWGTPNCGKGEPSQIMHVGHGASPTRFRKVRVGVGR
ncbi:MAG: hypothetical protein K6U08_06645, partial [Firmicutes bacterium]|nr:hypothetical protein [Bacillota bacterium]